MRHRAIVGWLTAGIYVLSVAVSMLTTVLQCTSIYSLGGTNVRTLSALVVDASNATQSPYGLPSPRQLSDGDERCNVANATLLVSASGGGGCWVRDAELDLGAGDANGGGGRVIVASPVALTAGSRVSVLLRGGSGDVLVAHAGTKDGGAVGSTVVLGVLSVPLLAAWLCVFVPLLISGAAARHRMVSRGLRCPWRRCCPAGCRVLPCCACCCIDPSNGDDAVLYAAACGGEAPSSTTATAMRRTVANAGIGAAGVGVALAFVGAFFLHDAQRLVPTTGTVVAVVPAVTAAAADTPFGLVQRVTVALNGGVGACCLATRRQETAAFYTALVAPVGASIKLWVDAVANDGDVTLVAPPAVSTGVTLLLLGLLSCSISVGLFMRAASTTATVVATRVPRRRARRLDTSTLTTTTTLSATV